MPFTELPRELLIRGPETVYRSCWNYLLRLRSDRCPTEAKQAAPGARSLTVNSRVLAVLALLGMSQVAPDSRC